MATSAERIKKTKIALNFIYQHMIENKTSVDQIVYEDDQAWGGGREDQEDWMRAAEEAREMRKRRIRKEEEKAVKAIEKNENISVKDEVV